MSEHIGFQYECSAGHDIGSSKPINRCPMARCDGELHAIGEGAQAENRRLKGLRQRVAS